MIKCWEERRNSFLVGRRVFKGEKRRNSFVVGRRSFRGEKRRKSFLGVGLEDFVFWDGNR